MTNRRATILNWLDPKHTADNNSNVLQPIVNDASQRQYYRYCTAGCSYIVMDSLHDQSLPQFIKVAQQLFAWGLCVPEIYKVDVAQGLLLLSDLGHDLYLDKLNPQTADQLYLAAIKALVVMQNNVVPAELQLAAMDNQYLQHRMAVFYQWFLQQHLNYELTTDEQQLFTDITNLFKQVFTAAPQVLVHLDYHSRNLLVVPGNQPGILDFQDAMIGPLGYDLVSLLQDAYIVWPRNKVEEWLAQYLQVAVAAGIIADQQSSQFIRSFDLIGLQRHLKNLGVFARLHHRDGKSKYLHSIPTLFQYIMETCRRYQELKPLQLFFEAQILPRFTTEALCKQ